MERVDLRILSHLELDRRMSYLKLGEAVGLSKTSCWSRVQGLEASGAIKRYSVDLDPASLGLGVIAHVHIMIDFSKRVEFESAVLAHAAILECMTTAGEADYILKIACRNVISLDDLLRDSLSLLPGVQRSTTMICLKTIKSRGSLADAALAA